MVMIEITRWFGLVYVSPKHTLLCVNRNGPHWLTGLIAWSVGTGTLRRCALVVVGVSLLKETWHRGWALRFQMLDPGLVSLSSCCLFIQLLSVTTSASMPPWYPL